MISLPYLLFKVTFKIKNDNFFKAELSNFKQDISWNHFLLNTTVISGNKNFYISGRAIMNVRKYFIVFFS